MKLNNIENKIVFCELEERHLPSLMKLYEQFCSPVDKDYDYAENFRKSLGQGIKYFGAVDSDNVLSTCYVAIIPNLTHGGKPIAFIENVVTDENHRRQGLGRIVIQMAINYAKNNNCYKVVLLSASHRTEAHKFYESLSFDGDSKRGFVINF
jgi:ribosomal protein S18 acetylase RimI-like enzyme